RVRCPLCAPSLALTLPFPLPPACLFRFNVLSLVYLLFLLLLPWFPGPTQRPTGGHTGRLLKALLGTSLLFLVAHFVFQICLYTLPALDQLLGPSCDTWEILARHIGVTRLDLSDVPNSVRLVAPDVGILLVSSLCLCLCHRLVPKAGTATRARRPDSLEPLEQGEEDGGHHGDTGEGDTPLSARLRVTAHWLLWAAGKGLAILLLALAGITLPSASSSIYYLLFVGLCTWWACHFPTHRLAFDTLCILVAIYAASHLLCLYAYQTPFIQGVFPPPTLWARLFGFKDIVLYHNCSQPNALVLNTDHPWPVYANPGILLLLYYTVATLVKLRWLDTKRTKVPTQPPARCPPRELVELESWPKDTDGVTEDTKPMLSPSTGKPGSGAENCTVHVMGNSPQPGELEPTTPCSQSPAGGSQSPSPWPDRRRPAEKLLLHTLGHVIMKQSYVCALIAMMVWSITYHSWLTFVLLLWACLIWTVRSRRHFAMLCSPFLLLYGIALCSLQYVWGMDLAPELPTRVGFMSLEQLGLVHPKYPCLVLGAKLLLTLTFWLLLRDFVKEKLLTRRCPTTPLLEVTTSDSEPSQQRDVLKTLGTLLRDFYAKYWICVCAGMFIVVSFAGRLVVYKIVYMFLFLLCLTLFQVYYSLWRKVLKGFWWLVVAYTMLVLIAVYTFQFEDFPMYWKNITGLTDEQLGDLGLEQFSVSELFSSTLIPGFFLLACILQLHYFHRPFMLITDLEHVPTATPAPCHIPRAEELHGSRLLRDVAAADSDGTGDLTGQGWGGVRLPTKWGLVLERLVVLGQNFSAMLTRGQVFVGRLLELHILKLVALYTVWVALQEVSLMNFLLVLLWAFAMPYSRFRHMASCLSTIWTCIIIVCKMLYQLKVVDPSEYSSNCTQPLLNSTNLSPEELNNSTLYRGPVDPANWFGIRKGYPNLGYIQNHLQVLLLLVFEAVVYRHQEHHRKQHQLVAPITKTIFEDISREHLDHGLGSCAKYFLNYFYYKFGLEICFLMVVNVIGQRMNFMVVLHGCWLLVILVRRRRADIARLWPKYCLFLVIFLLYQYLLCLGMPPALCVDYPWRWSQALPINSALIKWLYLPDFFVAPKSTNLINDFVLLVCAAQQWRVFEAERSEEWLRAAGDNSDRLDLEQDPHNPTPNFIHCRSYLDMAKVVVFRYLFWFVLVVVFITGATRISLFGLGYLLACFYLLLFGTAMLRKPARARLVLWDCLILYNITVIIAKNMLSLLSCVFVRQMQSSFCWMIQLFSLVCTVKGYYNPMEMGKDQDCSLPVEEAGIIWDSICFFFLLLQRRIFLSYYFLHVMLDFQASALQASRWGWGPGGVPMGAGVQSPPLTLLLSPRGVALFKASVLKSLRFHRQTEKKSLAQLKRQMERIRAKQEKYHQERLPRGTSEGEDETGAAPGGPTDPSRRRERWWRPWLDHAAVLHSGDYFLFESDSEEEEEAAVPEEPRPGRQSAFQLAYQAWVTSTRTALRQQEQLESPGAEDAAGGSSSPQSSGSPQNGRGNVVQRALNTLRFLWVLCQAMVDGLTQWLDTCTQEHRDMSSVLRLERYVLTRRLAKGEDMHRGVLDELYLPPAPEEPPEEPNPQGAEGAAPQHGVASRQHQEAIPALMGCPVPPSSQEQVTIQEDVAGSRELLALPDNRSRTASELLLSRRLYFPELEESEEFYRSHNRFLKLLLAGYGCVAAHSELLCYFVIILNNMVTASVISLFLPILIFLWAMLSIPRPSKRFWMTAIIFTEVMVVMKYLFQFGFFPWNSYAMLVRNEGKPFFPPRILGLEKTDHYIKYDLLQLLALFFHRSLLLAYGLWDHEEDPFPKKKAEVEQAEDEEEEGRREEAASPPLAVGEEETEVGAPGAAVGLEPGGDAMGQEEEEAKATQLRFRRKRRRGRKQPEVSPEEEDEEEEVEEEEEKEAKQSHAQRKLKALGLRVKLFFLTMAQNISQPVRGFFGDILHTQNRAATDVYAFMFLADVVDFIIIIFGFWAFGKHSAAADITSSLSDDQVPEAFLVMLLIQFTTMVIDRALYLRKTVLGKLIFQVILVFSIHLWMFFILPAVTERLFSLNTVAQLWYFVKCIYFALSAYQIRCGYPTRILGNFLTKKYNHLNLFLFQGYGTGLGGPPGCPEGAAPASSHHLLPPRRFRLVPFLVELRAVMDWVWTDTTLSLSNWMCVEDIYANIFIIKCSRETEKKYPQPKGQKKKKIVKYGMGGLIILFLVAIIWFPLLFMSLVRSVVGVVNHPIDVTVTLKLGGYEPLFTMSAQQQSIQPFTPHDYEVLTRTFERQPVAMQFITLYGYEDIVTAHIEGSSGSLWSISPPSREQMRRELQNGSSDITLRLTWTFQRDLGKGGTVEHTFDKHTTDLQPGAPQRVELAELLQGTRDTPVQVPKLFPKYIRAPNGPEANPVKQLLPDGEDSYLDVEVQLKRERVGAGRGEGGESFLEWWVVRLKDPLLHNGNILPMVIFNDKVSPPSLGFLAGYGIMGLYVSIVLVIGKFVRGFFSEISHSIMFEELPCVDRILKLCQDIFLVRETGELELEEELYAKLIFLYRSPETMIKWTREKE
ncbi:PIEZ1 protein, partial [Brachypteracias leptosomus]|nr:PIEZ1 protein [Brachypteracias leptosomus]